MTPQEHKTKIDIICPIHGEFKQKANWHISGNGCKKCAGNNKKTTSEFIREATIIHNNTYDYSLVEYKTAHSKIKINCINHGVFCQTD